MDLQCSKDLPVNVSMPLPSRQGTLEDSTIRSITFKRVSDPDDDELEAKKANTITLNRKLMYYKLVVTFGICCIVLLFLLPIILYYTEDSNGGLSPTADTGNIINTSQVASYVP